jgi:hypothetical protein
MASNTVQYKTPVAPVKTSKRFIIPPVHRVITPLRLGRKRTETTILRWYRSNLPLRKTLWIAQTGTKVQ